eukprot:gene16374-22576_t
MVHSSRLLARRIKKSREGKYRSKYGPTKRKKDVSKNQKKHGSKVVSNNGSKRLKKGAQQDLTTTALREHAKLAASYPSRLFGMQELCRKIRNPNAVFNLQQWRGHDEFMATASFVCSLGTFEASGTGIRPKHARLAAASSLVEKLVSLDDDNLASTVVLTHGPKKKLKKYLEHTSLQEAMRSSLEEGAFQLRLPKSFSCSLGAFEASGTGITLETARLAAASDLLEQLASLGGENLAFKSSSTGIGPRNARLPAASDLVEKLVSVGVKKLAFKANDTGIVRRSARLAAAPDLVEKLVSLDDDNLAFNATETEALHSDAAPDVPGNENGPVVPTEDSKKRKREGLTSTVLREHAKLVAFYPSSLFGLQELCGKIRNPHPVYDVYEVQQYEWMATVSFSCSLGYFKASGTGIGRRWAMMAAASSLLEQLASLGDNKLVFKASDTGVGRRSARLAAASDLVEQLVSLDDDNLSLNATEKKVLHSDAALDVLGNENGAVVLTLGNKKRKRGGKEPLTITALRWLGRMGASHASSLGGLNSVCNITHSPGPVFSVQQGGWDEFMATAATPSNDGGQDDTEGGCLSKRQLLRRQRQRARAKSGFDERHFEFEQGKDKTDKTKELAEAKKKRLPETETNVEEGKGEEELGRGSDLDVLPKSLERLMPVGQARLSMDQILAKRAEAAQAMIALEPVSNLRNSARAGAALAFNQCAELLRLAGHHIPHNLIGAIKECKMHGLIDILTVQLMQSLRTTSNIASHDF